MRRTIVFAAALLVIQAVLVVALNMKGNGGRDVSPAAPLFGFAPDAVTALEITGPSGDHLTIRKEGGGWVLPDDFGAPASSEQVNALLAKLVDLKQGLAVGTSEEAAKRFKVADTAFERHVVVKKGNETVADFFVGTSPGFRQVHTRKAGVREIFTTPLSTFELETGADKWLDKNLFRLKKEEMTSIAMGDFTLQKQGETWQLADLPQGKETAKEAADELVNGVAGLTIQDVVKPEEGAALFNGQPTFSYAVGMKDGMKLDYRFVKPEGDYYVVKRSDRDLYGKVHTIQVENLRKITKDKLIKQPAPAASEPAKESQGSHQNEGPPAEAGQGQAAGPQ